MADKSVAEGKVLVDLGGGAFAEKIVAVKLDGGDIGGSSSSTIADGDDATQGAIADAVVAAGAAGTLSAKLRRLTTDLDAVRAALAGTLAVSGPLTDAELRALAVAVSGPLTDAELRASAVPVDTELAAAVAAGDAVANPTAPQVLGHLMTYNVAGANWRRGSSATRGTFNALVMAPVLSNGNDGLPLPADGHDNTQLAMFSQALFNATNHDRWRSIAASGAGLGVARVGTMGELITLAASAARTSSANGSAVTGLGWRRRYVVLLDVTAAATDADDTLDVFVDVSLDGTTWLAAVHFTQVLGNGGAKQFVAVLDATSPPTNDIAVGSDPAAGVVRPYLASVPQVRARWAIVDPSGANVSFTFAVTAYAQ